MAPTIAPVKLKPDRSRLPLPKHLTDHIDWLVGKGDKDAWLLAIGEGRFRLLSDQQVSENVHLDGLRSLVQTGKPEDPNESTEVFSSEESSLPVRLLQVSLKPHASGWRMSMAKDIDMFLPANYNPNDWVMLFVAEGFWEIWHGETLRRSVSVPIQLGSSGANAAR